MDFRVLGPLEGSGGGRAVSLGPRKQRALLARLLLEPGRIVPVERLLDDLWGEEPPESAAKMVQIYVSGLRKVLPDGMLRTRSPGYALEIDPESVDLNRFERLQREAGAAVAAGDPVEAGRLLGEALALWRGPALAEFAEPFAERERSRLEELRWSCLEERIDADLSLGRHAEVVGELEALVAREPLRERPRGQLMLALYRCGRQADALSIYRDFHRSLDEELGLEPSPRLRELERAILRQEPELEPPPAAGAPPDRGPEESRGAPAGRAAEMAVLRRGFARALRGERRAVFVTGEPGTGKSTLVSAFAGSLAEEPLLAHGQCVEHRGAGEPYLPVLDAFGRAADGPYGQELVEALAERAQAWLVQLPWLIDFDYLEAVERRVRGTTRERMLREAVEALEALATRRPVVLVLEDLQWSDGPTLDLLSALMRRSTQARVLVVATSSPRDVIAGDESLRSLVHGLCMRGAAEEVALERLGEEAVGELLEERLGRGLPDGLARLVHERTGGNALFIAHLMEHWEGEGAIAAGPDGPRLTVPLERLATSVPRSLRASIEHAAGRLGEEDASVLRFAALAGREFPVAAVAAALELPDAEVAARCAALAAGTAPIRPAGEAEWPDGTVTTVYAFAHDLDRAVLADLVPPAESAAAHRRMGARLLDAHGPRAGLVATELAHHFVAGRDPKRAVRFLKLAADRAFTRLAYPEGINYVREALRAARLLDETPSRTRGQVELLSMLGQALVATEGWSSPNAEECLLEARAIADRLEDNEPRVAVLLALGTLYEVRGEYAKAAELAEAGRRLTPAGDASRRLQSQELLACSLFHQGSFARALEHAEAGAALFSPEDPDAGGFDTFPATMGDNAGVSCHDWAALAAWYLGRPDDAVERARRALALADDPARAHSRATACAQLAVLHQCRLEPELVLEWAGATIEAARERGYAYRVAMGRILQGWALVRLGQPERGIEELVCGVEASRITGGHMDDPYYLGLLADAYLVEGEVDAGLAAISEALELGSREPALFYEAELLRLRGLLLLARDPGDESAEGQLEEALAVARRQASPALELRAAVALARVRLQRGGGAHARVLVAPVRERFSEGFDTPDLRDAATLLSEGGATGAGPVSSRRAATAPPRGGVRYAENGDVSLAYRVFGEGELDLLLVTGWVLPMESSWEDPGYVRFLQRLGSFARVIMWDKRGTGLSDRMPPGELPTLEERVDDMTAVLDAAGAGRAAIFGASEGVLLSALFAATHPDRTRALALYGGWARSLATDKYPWGVTPEYFEQLVQRVRSSWEDPGDLLSLWAPTALRDERFRSWWSRALGLGASPRAAVDWLRLTAGFDIRDVLPAIDVPTLIAHRAGDQLVVKEHSRYLAEHIPNAEHVELAGEDHLWWVGDQDALVDAVESFLVGAPRPRAPERILTTVLFTDIVDSTRVAAELGDRAWRDLLAAHDGLVRAALERFHGHEVKALGDGFLATFDGPTPAIHCAAEIRDAVRPLGLEVRSGVHTGECELHGQDIAGIAVNIGARVGAVAGPGEILVSSTVRDLVTGSGIEFEDRGAHELQGLDGARQLLAVARA